MSIKISAFVVSYNRENIIGTCLRALQFVDEVILVDKSSSDATIEIATPLVDLIKIVPWSPTVEGTRAYAESLCAHDWILFLDDDECLNIEAIKFIENELQGPRALIYSFPLRHYICGVHSEEAYYWPEHHIRFYKKGSIKFGDSVHGSIQPQVEGIYAIPLETGACIYHFSHKDIAEWIEKTNRYTSQLERVRMHDPGAGSSIINYAHRAIDRWAKKKPLSDEAGYEAMVSVLRALYDIIDRLKCWGEFKFVGKEIFQEECNALDIQYQNFYNLTEPSRFRNAKVTSNNLTESSVKGDQTIRTSNVDPIGATLAIFNEERKEAGGVIQSLEIRNQELMQKMQEMHSSFEDERKKYLNHIEVTSRYVGELEKSNKFEIAFNIETERKYQNSFSWKITAPVRRVSYWMKKCFSNK